MILCADLNMIKNAHVPVNSAMLKMIMNIFNKDQIFFIAEKEHIKSVRRNIQGENIQYMEKTHIVDGHKFCIFVKEIIEFFNFLRLVYLYHKYNAKLLVLFSIFPLNHFLIKIVKKLFPRLKLLIVLHGELEYMREKERIKIKFFGQILKHALALKNDSNTYYLVLGEVIKKNLLLYFFMPNNQIISIDHPYDYIVIKNRMPKFNSIKIATIGIATKAKNTQFIFQLGLDLEKFILTQQLSLSIVGILEKSIKIYINNKVNYFLSDQLIDRKIFEESIEKNDYTVFFYDNSYYKMCASGAIFDAIKFEKPIIALRNDFFEYYFNLFGNIGYLCEDYNELRTKIEWIIRYQPHAEYKIQLNNLKQAKQNLSLDNITKKLNDKITKSFGLKSE